MVFKGFIRPIKGGIPILRARVQHVTGKEEECDPLMI